MSDPRSIPRSARSPALVLSLVALLAAGGLLAQVETRGGQTVVVAAGEVVADDLYVSAEVVRIEGTVRGDLIAAGREIIVEGEVEGDLLAAGQLVRVTGRVGDDARVAGQVLHLGPEARVGDDLVAAGYSLHAEPGSALAGTAIVFGYQALLAGAVTEGLRGALAALEIAGTVGGDVEVEVGEATGQAPPAFWPMAAPVPSVRPGLTLADGARVEGDLVYESPDAARTAAGAAVAGEVRHRQPEDRADEPTPAGHALDALRRLAALLLVGGLLLLVAPLWIAGLADTARARPLPALGWGLVFLAAAAVAALLVALATALVAVLLGLATLSGLAAAVVGAGVLAEAALVVALIVACAWLPPVVVGLAGGRLAVARSGAPSRGRSFAALALGVLVLVLLGLVPVLGTVVAVLVLLVGLGSLWIWGLGRLRARPAPAAAVLAEPL